jgi:hypothetical protein
VTALKVALFILLALNTVYFAVAETASKAVDSAAWFTLLVLFSAETSFAATMAHRHAKTAVRAVRLVAVAAVVAATVGYLFEDNLLDAVNATLWILVVILLEVELRWPAPVARYRVAFKASAVALYGGLALLVLIWAAMAMWVDAYDAVLWLVAFGLIELHVTKRYTTADAIAS